MQIICPTCKNEIKIRKCGDGYMVGCGSISCMNAAYSPTLRYALEYAESIYGHSFKELIWDGKKVKEKGVWLVK